MARGEPSGSFRNAESAAPSLEVGVGNHALHDDEDSIEFTYENIRGIPRGHQD
jgi:hypothetical protein